MTKHFHGLIIGSGQAGPFLAGRLAESGRQIAIVERNHSGALASHRGEGSVDIPQLNAYRDAIVAESRNVVSLLEFGLELRRLWLDLDLDGFAQRIGRVTHERIMRVEPADDSGAYSAITLPISPISSG